MKIIVLLFLLGLGACFIPLGLVMLVAYLLGWIPAEPFQVLFTGNLFFWGIFIVLGFYLFSIFQKAATIRRLLKRTYPAQPEIIQMTNAFKLSKQVLWRTFYMTNIVWVPLSMILLFQFTPELEISNRALMSVFLIPVLGPIGYWIIGMVFTQIQESHLQQMREHIDRINQVKSKSDFKLPVLDG